MWCRREAVPQTAHIGSLPGSTSPPATTDLVTSPSLTLEYTIIIMRPYLGRSMLTISDFCSDARGSHDATGQCSKKGRELTVWL